MDIVQQISELIYDHDCVIVPELGGFISNYQPATIHPVQHQFHPPSKNILFNEALTSNDGLLTNHIANRHKISYESAMEKIREFVADVKHTLGNGETIELNHIGKLSADRSGVIRFEQTPRVNYLKDVYGMSSFVSPAIRRDVQRTAKVVKPAFAEDQKTHHQNQAVTVAFRIAASLAIVLMLGIAGFNLFRNTPVDTHESGLHTSISELVNQPVENNGSDADSEYTSEFKNPVETTAPANENNSNGTPSSTNKNPVEPEADNPEETPVPLPAAPISEKIHSKQVTASAPYVKKYHLIAGSFLDEENAGKLTGKYAKEGFQPNTIGPSSNGYYRVSIAAYLRKDEALTELEKARKDFDPNIWLLRY